MTDSLVEYFIGGAILGCSLLFFIAELVKFRRKIRNLRENLIREQQRSRFGYSDRWYASLDHFQESSAWGVDSAAPAETLIVQHCKIDDLFKIIDAREHDIACLEAERVHLQERIAELEDALMIRRVVGGVHTD